MSSPKRVPVFFPCFFFSRVTEQLRRPFLQGQKDTNGTSTPADVCLFWQAEEAKAELAKMQAAGERLIFLI